MTIDIPNSIKMLEKEFKYYLDNQESIVEKYNGKFIVIKDEKIIGVYNSNQEAYHKTIETELIGTFLIQHCTPGTEGYTQHFFSRVSFS